MKVLYFSWIKDKLGKSHEEIQVSDNIKTINDLQTVGNENLTLEMYIIQMIYLKDLGENKEIQNNMTL